MPSPEKNPFADFINSIPDDFARFSGKVDNDIEGVHEAESIKAIDIIDERKFTYDVEVGLAHFTTTIDTDLREGSLSLAFPSKIRHFELEEMQTAITDVFEAAFYKQHHTPRVQVRFESDEKDYDLANYWDGKLYEKAIKSEPTSVTYYIPNDVSSYSQSLYVSSNPRFMYGFSRINEEEIMEFTKMSHFKGSLIDVSFSRELLQRNRGYIGRDLERDSINLRDKIQGLHKTHPQEKIL